MPNDYVRPIADSWGYYTGGSVAFAEIPNFSQTYSSLQYTLAEVLTEVIYPTGGKSRFEYELNNYSKVVAPSLMSLTDKVVLQAVCVFGVLPIWIMKIMCLVPSNITIRIPVTDLEKVVEY